MLRSKLVTTVLFALLPFTAFSEAQNPPANALTGYLDPSTGAFRPMPKASDFSVQVATLRRGLFIFRFDISIRSQIPPTHAIACTANANTFDSTAAGIFLETAAVYATRTGNKPSCTVRIPYSWVLDEASANRIIYLTYSIGAINETGRTGFASRQSTGPIASVAVPDNGVTTTFTINAVI